MEEGNDKDNFLDQPETAGRADPEISVSPEKQLHQSEIPAGSEEPDVPDIQDEPDLSQLAQAQESYLPPTESRIASAIGNKKENLEIQKLESEELANANKMEVETKLNKFSFDDVISQKLKAFSIYKEKDILEQDRVKLATKILTKIHDFVISRASEVNKRVKFVQRFYDSYVEDLGTASRAQDAFFKKIKKKKKKNCDEFEVFVEDLRKSLKEREKKIKELKNKFIKEIIQNLDKNLKAANYHKKYTQLMESCGNLRETLIYSLKEGNEMNDQFVKEFNRSMNVNKKKKFYEKDMFCFCRQINATGVQLRRIIATLGLQVVELFRILAAKEKNVSVQLSSSLNKFQSFVKSWVSPVESASFAVAMKSLEKISSNFSKVDELYVIERILDQEELNQLGVTHSDLNRDLTILAGLFFRDLKPPRTERYFLNSLNAAKISEGAIITAMKQCEVFMTLDYYLVVYKTEMNELLLCKKLKHFDKEYKVSGHNVTLTYIKKGIIFNSNKELKLTFSCDDLAEKFVTDFTSLKTYIAGVGEA